MLWAVVQKNRRLLEGSSRVAADVIEQTSKDSTTVAIFKKASIKKLMKAVDQARKAEDQARIDRTHKQTGYSSYLRRVPGSFEGGDKR